MTRININKSMMQIGYRDYVLENFNHVNGKVVQRYNIEKAQIESYFISSENLNEYVIAKSKQDSGVYTRLGIRI